MTFSIREGRTGDIDSLIKLLKTLFAIEKDFEFNHEKQRRGLMAMMTSDSGCLFVAEENGRVIGMVSVQVLISTAEGGKVGLIEDLVVAEKYLRKGVGVALIEKMEEWARKNRLLRLQLLADRHNESALKFYEKVGWSKTDLIALRNQL